MPAYNIERLGEAAVKSANQAEKDIKKRGGGVDVEIKCTYDMPFATHVLALLHV